MATQKKLLWIAGIVLAVIVARYLGVPLNTLLIVGAVLLCPAAMYFGMRGMGQQSDQRRGGTREQPHESESKLPAAEDKSRRQTKS